MSTPPNPENQGDVAASTVPELLPRDMLVEQCAVALVEAFAHYNREFRAITRRAPQRFESRDWRASLRDAVERIELYDRSVNRAVAQMKAKLGEDASERMHRAYGLANFAREVLVEAQPELQRQGCDVAPLL